MSVATDSTVDKVRALVGLLDPADAGGDVFVGARGRPEMRQSGTG
jgi:hypothetical protein